MCAESFNEAGLSIQQVLKSTTMDIDWSEESIKEILWRTAQERIFGKRSTKELDKNEVTKVYETINRFAGNLGVELPPFPHYCTEHCPPSCQL